MLKNKIKMLALSTIIITGTIGLGGCGKKTEVVNLEDDFKVTLILDEGGVNDQSFNQSAWEGAKLARKEYDGVEVSYIESKQESEYISNIETAIDNESDLIIGVGFKLTSAIEESAKSYPDKQFAIVDGSFENGTPKNVTPILFNEEQSGYLVGLVAAKTTQTNKVGFVGGMEIPSVTNFLIGYEKAVKEVNPEIEVISQYANSFTDSAKGKAIGSQMYAGGADIIFTAGGGVNSGIYESAREFNKKAIAVDMPSSYIAPDVILTSALKNVGNGVRLTINEAMNERLVGGKASIFDINNGGVDFERTNLIDLDTIKFIENKIKELKNK